MVFRMNNTPESFTCDLQRNLDSWDEFRSENLGKRTTVSCPGGGGGTPIYRLYRYVPL